ncbi:MAG: C13 family peptidase [Candidatus Sumerlaeia bacterium]|nr:C13 family peptidase [Candidatus Sumerlaeia bacterium]
MKIFLPVVGLLLALPEAQAASRHIIICGSGGDPAYEAKFAAWGRRLATVLVEQMGQSPDSVALLTESGDGATSGAARSDREAVRTALERAAAAVGPEDDLFIYLIGHGSHWRQVSRFHVPGPDLTADDLAAWLAPVRARNLVLINAASCSAGFINKLSAPGRIICTATRSVDERNATEFMEYFLQGLEDDSADQNRDERVSVLEAARQAAALTDAFYVGRGLLATEHALLDDNGDGRGTRLAENAGDEGRLEATDEKTTATADGADGARAARCFLRDFRFPPSVPRELADRYRALLDRIEALKREKGRMESGAYYGALEPLLIEAARVHRDIRAAAGAEGNRKP